jgi:hypothetical protein
MIKESTVGFTLMRNVEEFMFALATLYPNEPVAVSATVGGATYKLEGYSDE